MEPNFPFSTFILSIHIRMAYLVFLWTSIRHNNMLLQVGVVHRLFLSVKNAFSQLTIGTNDRSLYRLYQLLFYYFNNTPELTLEAKNDKSQN